MPGSELQRCKWVAETVGRVLQRCGQCPVEIGALKQACVVDFLENMGHLTSLRLCWPDGAFWKGRFLMQTPDRTTPIDRCASLSLYTESVIAQFGETFTPSPEAATQLPLLSDVLATSRGTLTLTQSAYLTAVLQCIAPRVAVMLIDMRADSVVRSAKRGADDAGKDVALAVFPDGVSPIIRPIGQSEVNALLALEGRLHAAIPRWPEAATWQERIATVRARYETALSNRASALNEAASKRAVRNAARESFLDTYASAAAQIKALFPRDKTMQDIFFDEVRTRGAEAEGEAEEGVILPVV